MLPDSDVYLFLHCTSPVDSYLKYIILGFLKDVYFLAKLGLSVMTESAHICEIMHKHISITWLNLHSFFVVEVSVSDFKGFCDRFQRLPYRGLSTIQLDGYVSCIYQLLGYS